MYIDITADTSHSSTPSLRIAQLITSLGTLSKAFSKSTKPKYNSKILLRLSCHKGHTLLVACKYLHTSPVTGSAQNHLSPDMETQLLPTFPDLVFHFLKILIVAFFAISLLALIVFTLYLSYLYPVLRYSCQSAEPLNI